MQIDGGCHCGHVKYEAEIDPDKVVICHCTDCQRLTGSAYRVTAVTPGTNYRFQVYAYVWSTALDNVDLSENPGGVIVQVGIDPTGGTNPESTAIVWSDAGSPQYDAYFPYEVSAPVQGSAVSVFVRSISAARFVASASAVGAGASSSR